METRERKKSMSTTQDRNYNNYIFVYGLIIISDGSTRDGKAQAKKHQPDED
jgi:hypothetical protein